MGIEKSSESDGSDFNTKTRYCSLVTSLILYTNELE